MQPDQEIDELQALLRDEYGAPPLDGQFSADLVARLQAEASLPQTPSLASTESRRSLLAICLGIAAIAASIIAVVWILNQKPPGANREVARGVKIDSNRSTLMDLDTLSEESEDERLDRMSVSPRTMSLSESLSQRSESERKYSSELSRAQRNDNLATEERALKALPQATLSLLSTIQKDWPRVSAAVALADMLYVVDSGRLYEVSPNDGSRRSVGDDRWQNTAALGAAGGYLYLVCDDHLYEVDPKTGARRSAGKADWANTKAIVTVGDKLYVASKGLLYRVDPNDGSHEVLHSKTESLNQSLQPKQ